MAEQTPSQKLSDNLTQLQQQVPFMQALSTGHLPTEPNEQLIQIEQEAKYRIATHILGLLCANPEAGNAFATGLVAYTNNDIVDGTWYEVGKRRQTTHVNFRISPGENPSSPPHLYLVASADRKDTLETALRDHFAYTGVASATPSEDTLPGWQVNEVTTTKRSGNQVVSYTARKPFTVEDGIYHFDMIQHLASRMVAVYGYLIERSETTLRRVHAIDTRNYATAKALLDALSKIDPQFTPQHPLRHPADPTRLLPTQPSSTYVSSFLTRELGSDGFDEDEWGGRKPHNDFDDLDEE